MNEAYEGVCIYIYIFFVLLYIGIYRCISIYIVFFKAARKL